MHVADEGVAAGLERRDLVRARIHAREDVTLPDLGSRGAAQADRDVVRNAGVVVLESDREGPAGRRVPLGGATLKRDVGRRDGQVGGATTGLAAGARRSMEAAREVIDRLIGSNATAYGVNTGFGELATVRIPPDQVRQLQVNLVRSHACGVGVPLSGTETRALLLLRANALALRASTDRAICSPGASTPIACLRSMPAWNGSTAATSSSAGSASTALHTSPPILPPAPRTPTRTTDMELRLPAVRPRRMAVNSAYQPL